MAMMTQNEPVPEVHIGDLLTLALHLERRPLKTIPLLVLTSKSL